MDMHSVTMKYLLPSNIGKACSAKNTRYALAGYSIEAGKDGPYAMATDGRILAAVRLEDAEGFPDVPKTEEERRERGRDDDSWQRWPTAIIPRESVGTGGAVVELNGRIESRHRLRSGKAKAPAIYEPVEGQTPPYHEAYDERKPRAWVSLNAQRLRDLAEAIGSDGAVNLGFRLDDRGRLDQDGGIAVLPWGAAKAEGFGLLMPLPSGDHGKMTERYRQRVNDSSVCVTLCGPPTMPPPYGNDPAETQTAEAAAR